MTYYEKLRTMIGKVIACEGREPGFVWKGELLEVYYHAGGEGVIALELRRCEGEIVLVNPAHCLFINRTQTPAQQPEATGGTK